MISRDTNWREIGDVPYTTWQSVIRSNGGPAELAGIDGWNAASPHSALALAMLKVESSYATDFDANPASNRNPLNLKKPNGGGYVWYPNWASGIEGWRERITSPLYKSGVYKNTSTIKDLIYVYAPPFDQTKTTTDAYIDTIVRLTNDWERVGTGTTPAPGGGNVALTIKQQIIPTTNRNRPGTKLNANPAKWITIHETGNYNAGAGAQMHSTFVRNGGGSEGVSFHMTVDDELAIQMMPLDEVAYHAGDGCDSRDTDLGCFQSVAIETCVNSDANWTVTKENLVQLCVAIIKGDSRLLFNGTNGHFSPQRLGQHNKWSGKNCPERLRGEGSWANITGRIATGAVGQVPEPPPSTTPAPVPDILPGLSLEVARRLFGQAKGDKTGRIYKYTATGTASRMWLEDGEATGEWPMIEEAWEYDEDHVYLVFEGGRVYYRAHDDVIRLGKG
jgi:N-acetylmuramoyl-L-alanine amidase CwlA